MLSLNRLIKNAAPEIVRELVRTRRALREHEKTRPLWQMIDQELLEDARLVSDVFVLLDRMPRGSVVAEIGVATGGLSGAVSEAHEPEEALPGRSVGRRGRAGLLRAQLHRIRARMKQQIEDEVVVLKRGYSYDVLPTFPSNHFDWVYVDGAHDYEGVRRDLQDCYEIVKPGGLIAGHDYIRWVSPTQRYGVVEAVNEFVNRTRSSFVMLTNQLDKHDSFAIRLNK